MRTQKEKAAVAPAERQEAYYDFPYHWLSDFRTGFRAHRFDSWALNYITTIEMILDRLKIVSWSSLLDIGCGDGRLAEEVARDFPDRIVEGVDYSAKAISLARALCTTPTFHHADIVQEVLPRLYDCAVCVEVYEHIPPSSAAEFVAAVHRLLTPGATLLLTVPHSNKPVEEHHFRHFDSRSLRAEWAQRFQIEEITGFERVSRLRPLLAWVLGNRYFVLNHGKLLRLVHCAYRRFLVPAPDEGKCQRLFLAARKGAELAT